VVSSFIKDGNHDRNEILSKVIINTNKEVFITPRKNHANTI